MRIITLIILILTLSGEVFSQAWFPQNSGVTSNLWSVDFINKNTGVIVGDEGKILRTTNRGDNWTSIVYTTDHLRKLEFFGNTGYVLTSGTTHIHKTTNGGLNWFSISTPSSTLDQMAFLNADSGYVMTFNSLLKTSNGGQNWISLPYPNDTTQALSIIFFDFNEGLILHNTSVVSSELDEAYKTTNGGITWSESWVMRGVNASHMDWDKNAPNFGYWVSFSTTFSYRTLNRGISWFNSNFPHDSKGITFISPNLGLSLHSEGIHKTTNGGTTASGIYTNPYPTFHYNGIKMTDSNDIYLVGNEGRILVTRTGGVTAIDPISTELPASYVVFQNFPNPFNPTTHIRFSIPKASFTKITVYNSIGNEVAKLLNEDIKAGSYEVTFHGSYFASGIYYYRIESGPFSETKKMLLIK